ncbi:MAG: DUF5046 domain-containing protein [Clostridiales bacterium]|nr:DUF5046 domain-containing protein [Clostridiales bacterium]
MGELGDESQLDAAQSEDNGGANTDGESTLPADPPNAAAGLPKADAAAYAELNIPEPFLGERYTIPLYMDFYSFATSIPAWVVDRDGNTIPEDEQFVVLYDVLTGEPQCQFLTKTVERGKELYKDEYNEFTYIVARDISALFDLEGNMIYDWGEYYYRPGFGDFVIRQESWHPEYDGPYGSRPGASELLNFKTKRRHMADVYEVSRLSDNEALLSYDEYKPMGVMNKSGAKRSGFPVDEQYAYTQAWNGYIIASTHSRHSRDDQTHRRDFLLTPDFEEILAYRSLRGSSVGEFLLYTYRTDEHTATRFRKGIITPDGKELYRMSPDLYNLDVRYFDGNYLVLSRFIDRSDTYNIVTLKNGEVVVENATNVSTFRYDGADPLETLLAYKDDTLHLIDKDGLAGTKKVSRVTTIMPSPNGYFSITFGGTESMLLDSDLNEVIPNGIYNRISRQASYQANFEYGSTYYYGDSISRYLYDVFICTRDVGQNIRIMDLVDSQGRVLVEGLNSVRRVGPNRLAVRKGFDAGLMDWQGNWIVKRSLFSEFQND